ncbi:S8 family serine peptidase [Vandammella animalimorsus]|nr:S8 family serine peptidase [Vandammella animalimorsus]
MNSLDANENIFEFNNPVGRALAIASNNNLILQSAGNDDSSNACNKGYSFDNSIAYPWDGIMLIGGIERSGGRATSDQVRFHNSGALNYVGASNYGPCVELWAPSKQITSIRFKTNQTQVLSGTSFAAPITAAISARYGSNTTRPLEREWFIKNSSRHTGYYAAGIPIKSVHWKNNQANTLTRHIIRSIWSPQNNNNINMLYDGAYQSAWNAGTNSGRIIIDLGEEKGVKFIRVTPRSSVPLQNNSPIYFSIAPTNSSNGSHATGPIQTFSQHKHGDRAPITIPLNNMHTRYIILNGHNYGSWLAYSEVEVYGQ